MVNDGVLIDDRLAFQVIQKLVDAFLKLFGCLVSASEGTLFWCLEALLEKARKDLV